MNRILRFAAAAALVLSLAACGNKTKPAATPEEQLATAKTMVGEEVSTLYDAVGEPEDSSYASSCIGDGEDGELHYDGFTVYTYRDTDGGETIQDVLEVS